MSALVPARLLGLRVVKMNGIPCVRIPFKNNYNDKRTQFAGSLYAGAVLAGYSLARQMMLQQKIAGTLVCSDGSITYRRPLTGTVLAVPRSVRDFSRVVRRKRRVRIAVELRGPSGEPGATAAFVYVALLPVPAQARKK